MGTFPHKLTKEELSRGSYARAEKIRERKAKAEALAVERLATKISRAAKVYVEAMEAETPGATITFKDGTVKEIEASPDHRSRIAGADRTMDRVLGKVAQAVEHAGPEGEPIQVEHRGVSLDDILRVAASAGQESDRPEDEDG